MTITQTFGVTTPDICRKVIVVKKASYGIHTGGGGGGGGNAPFELRTNEVHVN